MKEQPKTGGRFTRHKGNGTLKQIQKPTAAPEPAMGDSANVEVVDGGSDQTNSEGN